jgi:glutathione S-transferase
MSHYSEKARWALDHKGIAHRRRSAPGGAHLLVALAKTRGGQITFPVLELDGTAVGGSAAIVAALDERYPERRLLPADPAQRERVLALQAYFDDVVAPASRHVAWSQIAGDRELLEEIAPALTPTVPVPPAVNAALIDRFVRLRYGAGPDADQDQAQATIVAALDRIEAERAGSPYLIGDAFTAADLAAAALLYPVVLPGEGPQVVPRFPRGIQPFIDNIASHPAYAWVRETYRRHRAPEAARPS